MSEYESELSLVGETIFVVWFFAIPWENVFDNNLLGIPPLSCCVKLNDLAPLSKLFYRLEKPVFNKFLEPPVAVWAILY